MWKVQLSTAFFLESENLGQVASYSYITMNQEPQCMPENAQMKNDKKEPKIEMGLKNRLTVCFESGLESSVDSKHLSPRLQEFPMKLFSSFWQEHPPS